jgi:mono/diheme cytochrome c family protein
MSFSDFLPEEKMTPVMQKISNDYVSLSFHHHQHKIMLIRVYNVILTIGLFFFMTNCTKDKPDPPLPDPCDTTQVTYSGIVKTIVDQNCAVSGCHVPGGSGNGDFTSYPGLKEKVDNGSFIKHIITQKSMPPPPRMLSDCDRNKLLAWVNKGALNN